MKRGYLTFTDYFLRYISEIPEEEAELHEAFKQDCDCRPIVLFDEKDGWHTITHSTVAKDR